MPNSAHIAARSNKPGVIPSLWSVQIGNFAQRANAHKAAIRARRMADDVLGMTPAHLMLVSCAAICRYGGCGSTILMKVRPAPPVQPCLALAARVLRLKHVAENTPDK